MQAERRMLALMHVAAILVAVPLWAHHSDQAHYDERQPVTLMGTVTKVQWANPHVQLNLDVKDSNGMVNNWQLELNSPNALMSAGWKVDSIKQGDVITVTGFRARDGSYAAIARKVKLDPH